MRFLSKKGVVLFAGVMAVCAFVVPAIASADSFILDSGTFPNTQILHSSNLSFNIPAIPMGWSCASSTFDVSVRSASDAQVLGAGGFSNCHGTGAGSNCTLTPVATRTPWTVTPSTGNLQIHDIVFDITFENTPGAAAACGSPGTTTLTGTLSNGVWNNAAHSITYTDGTGLSLLFGTAAPGLVTGTLVATQKNLTIS
jgi:hypothetical protein